MKISFAGVVCAWMLHFAVPVSAQAPQSVPTLTISAGLEQLRHVEGDWAVTTEFFGADGRISATYQGSYHFQWVIPDAVLSGVSQIPALDMTSALLFYLRPASNEIEMVSVGKDGLLWIMTGRDGEEHRTTREIRTKDGGSMRLRFTRYNVAQDSFESRMELSTDGGETWTQANHQLFRRCTHDGHLCSDASGTPH